MSKNKKIVFSFIILFIGITIFLSEYFNSKKIEVYDYMNELYYEQIVTVEENISEVEESDIIPSNNEESIEGDKNNNYKINYDDYYIGYLRIPKLNLKKGFTTKENKYNNVNKNIQILADSDYPDTNNGNVIIAGHSGNSSVSFFNTLYQLDKGENVYIDYKNKIYTYKIANIYTVEKTGKLTVRRNKDIKTLTLITCTKGDKTTQTVYICELVNEE